MHEGAAYGDDISNGNFDVNFAKAFVDLLIARTADSGEGFLIANFLSVSKFLLELILGTHESQQGRRQVKINSHLDNYANL